jgi:hypothetical protein
MTNQETIWILWKCDNGRRWSTVKGGICDDQRDGAFCLFSGCKERDHRIHRVKEVTADTYPDNWFTPVQ